ncbi:hypothetical protein [Nonomuraea jabiensis]|uniref:hypothetical protein n=1 Tax=Nonomuraea jabiensis TaxID=882448 RepID=UPI0036812DC3
MIVVTVGEEVWFAEQARKEAYEQMSPFMPDLPSIRRLGLPQRHRLPLMAPRGALPMRLTP